MLNVIKEDLIHEPVLKLWALDKKDKKSDTPECVTTLSVQNGKKQFPVRTV